MCTSALRQQPVQLDARAHQMLVSVAVWPVLVDAEEAKGRRALHRPRRDEAWLLLDRRVVVVAAQRGPGAVGRVGALELPVAQSVGAIQVVAQRVVAHRQAAGAPDVEFL